MPSITTIKMNINFEPSSGFLEVLPAPGTPGPSEGFSLDTVFTIRAVNFVDEDTPLSYRFYYYSDPVLYETERVLGVTPVSSRRDFLSEIGYVNQLETRLPLGRDRVGNRVLLMVSIIDALGATTNSTIEIRVRPRFSSLE